MALSSPELVERFRGLPGPARRVEWLDAIGCVSPRHKACTARLTKRAASGLLTILVDVADADAFLPPHSDRR